MLDTLAYINIEYSFCSNTEDYRPCKELGHHANLSLFTIICWSILYQCMVLLKAETELYTNGSIEKFSQKTDIETVGGSSQEKNEHIISIVVNN